MAFSVFYISNNREQYSDLYIEHFNNEAEKSQFLSSTLESGDKISYVEFKTYMDMVVTKVFNEQTNGADETDVHRVNAELVEKFGSKLIGEEFSNEIVDDKFVEKVIERCDVLFDEMMEDYYENHADKEHQDYGPSQTDVDIAYDEETSRWDEETGGSWRIENDFG